MPSCRQIALDIGIHPNILTRWKREAEAKGQAFEGVGSPRDEEMTKVKKERDFLREAATFFAKELPQGTRR